jgi:hypothetical protein
MDAAETTAAAWAEQIERQLVAVVAQLGVPPPRTGPGRPPLVSAAVLWASLTLAVLRGTPTQRAVWRIAISAERWPRPRVVVTDEAVYRRLAAADPLALERLYRQITEHLVGRCPLTPAAAALAPFATDVVVFDETTLDQVARTLAELRKVPAGSEALLPGKVAGVFDLRRQLWRTLELIPHPHQNEKVAARHLLASVAPGSLILADLGYFGFAWFDQISAATCWWISRLRAKTSTIVRHVHYQDETTFDGLVWLGAYRSDKAAHLVRLVRFQVGSTTYAYLTNVRDPHQLPLAEIARLYARRWDIELAVKLVKREVGLALWWSAKPAVLQLQLWATLLIAQLLLALRREIALRAEVDDFDISLPLMIRYLPEYVTRFPADPLGAFIADGRLMGFIRESTRTQIRAPAIPPEQLVRPPARLRTVRTPRYAHRKCGSRRTTPKPTTTTA